MVRAVSEIESARPLDVESVSRHVIAVQGRRCWRRLTVSVACWHLETAVFRGSAGSFNYGITGQIGWSRIWYCPPPPESVLYAWFACLSSASECEDPICARLLGLEEGGDQSKRPLDSALSLATRSASDYPN